MLTVRELKEACEAIEREFGSDANVIIQIFNEDGSFMHGDYLIDRYRDSAGNLYLTNHKFKHGNCM